MGTQREKIIQNHIKTKKYINIICGMFKKKIICTFTYIHQWGELSPLTGELSIK